MYSFITSYWSCTTMSLATGMYICQSIHLLLRDSYLLKAFPFHVLCQNVHIQMHTKIHACQRRVHIAVASSCLLDQEQELLLLPLVLCSCPIVDWLLYFSWERTVFTYIKHVIWCCPSRKCCLPRAVTHQKTMFTAFHCLGLLQKLSGITKDEGLRELWHDFVIETQTIFSMQLGISGSSVSSSYYCC